MYAIISRFGGNSPWLLKSTLYPDRNAAIDEVVKFSKYDLTRSEYRIIPLGALHGDPDSWENPLTPPRDVVRMCDACGMEAKEGYTLLHREGCPNE